MHEGTGDDSYLDRAVGACEQAAHIPVNNASSRAAWLASAAQVLHRRYDARGDEADLERSISYSRQALTAAPDGDFDIPGWLSNLGNTLRHRYERTGAIADLDDAIEILDRAVRSAPEHWMDAPTCLTRLGIALSARGTLSRSPEYLARGLQASAKAVTLTPETAASFGIRAMNLAVAIGRADDAEQITMFEELLEVIPKSSTAWPRLLANLADALLRRAESAHNLADVPRAIDLARAALDQTTPEAHEFAERTALLARALSFRAERDSSEAAEAHEAFRRSCVMMLHSAPAQCLANAMQWTARSERTFRGRMAVMSQCDRVDVWRYGSSRGLAVLA